MKMMKKPPKNIESLRGVGWLKTKMLNSIFFHFLGLEPSLNDAIVNKEGMSTALKALNMRKKSPSEIQ